MIEPYVAPCECPGSVYHLPICPHFDSAHDPADYGPPSSNNGHPCEEDDYRAEADGPIDTDYPGRWRDGEAATRDTYPPGDDE